MSGSKCLTCWSFFQLPRISPNSYFFIFGEYGKFQTSNTCIYAMQSRDYAGK